MSATPALTITPEASWPDAVDYQVHPRTFANSDSDGSGDLRGIAEHLDHHELLGVHVI